MNTPNHTRNRPILVGVRMLGSGTEGHCQTQKRVGGSDGCEGKSRAAGLDVSHGYLR